MVMSIWSFDIPVQNIFKKWILSERRKSKDEYQLENQTKMTRKTRKAFE